MTEDDHPVRTIFIECVARRCDIGMQAARKFIAPISTDVIDTHWPLEAVVEQHGKGDLVAVFYAPK